MFLIFVMMLMFRSILIIIITANRDSSKTRVPSSIGQPVYILYTVWETLGWSMLNHGEAVHLRNSYPFDWTRSSLEGILHCMDNKFEAPHTCRLVKPHEWKTEIPSWCSWSISWHVAKSLASSQGLCLLRFPAYLTRLRTYAHVVLSFLSYLIVGWCWYWSDHKLSL